MPTHKGDEYQQNFAEWGPFPAKRIVFAGVPNTHAYTAIRRYHLEDNVEGGEGQGLRVVMVRLSNADDNDGKTEPPYIVA